MYKNDLKDGILTIYVDRRIDSTNASEKENELVSIISESDPKSVILDFDELEYISSAGLRVILKIKKTVADTKIINCSSDVYDVFEMTGFSEMMEVSKAYRKMNVDGLKVIGEGANGTVYRYNDDTIIKVYKDPDAINDILRERVLARKAFVLGVPTAISYDVVRVGESYGSVFELLDCKCLRDLLVEAYQNKDEYVDNYVALLKKIHETEVSPDDMPSAKEKFIGYAKGCEGKLDADIYEKLLKLVDSIPESNMMIHGDCHIKNIMVQNGEYLLIDMDTLAHGHPIFDFVGLYLGYRGFGELNHEQTAKFMGCPYDRIEYVFDNVFNRYFGDQAKRDDAYDKVRCLSYMRLYERQLRHMRPGNADDIAFLEYMRNGLIELVKKLDTLNF